MRPRAIAALLLAAGLAACADQAPLPTEPPQLRKSKPDQARVGVNVLLAEAPSEHMLEQLVEFGRLRGELPEINAVFIVARESDIPAIEALPFVLAANPDAERTGRPLDTVSAEDFLEGLSTWNLDAINVTDFGPDNRVVSHDGTGVYVAVLDTGLRDTWRRYFPEERIATEYARSFGGGGVAGINVSQQPNKWEHDTDSHGTHVTSTILGYSLRGTPIAGTAPKATVIPVKVLDQTGSGWSSVIAAGIRYVAELKAGPLADDPVVINMSLGGPYVDAVEQAAIDYAITKGVIVVAAAGNYGARGMAFPGSYEPVISVASAGWIHEWTDCGPGERAWWLACDISDPTPADEFYVPGYSSRAKPGQELDVTAPGELVVGPYQLQSGHIEYWFLGGTSMAAPHVAGVVALMAEKHPGLTAAEAEGILEGTALALVGYDAKDQGAGLIQADLALAATP